MKTYVPNFLKFKCYKSKYLHEVSSLEEDIPGFRIVMAGKLNYTVFYDIWLARHIRVNIVNFWFPLAKICEPPKYRFNFFRLIYDIENDDFLLEKFCIKLNKTK